MPCTTKSELSALLVSATALIWSLSIDAELLTEVDDEYWINPDPELAFKQPEGKPSRIAFSNCLIRLLKILAFASRTIVSVQQNTF